MILFELTNRGNSFVLEDETGVPIKAPRSVILPKSYITYDKGTSRKRKAMYYDGCTSIWADEQQKNGDHELYGKDEFGNLRIPSENMRIVIRDGFLSVRDNDTFKLEYIRNMPLNEGNEGRTIFKERNFLKEARTAAKQELQIAHGITSVMNLQDKQLLYAYTTYFPEGATPEKEIMQAKLIDVAKHMANVGDLDVFINNIQSPDTYRFYRVVNMFKRDIVSLGGDGTLIKLSSSGSILCQVPRGEDYYDILMSWFDSEKGRVTYKHLDKKLKEMDSNAEEAEEIMSRVNNAEGDFKNYSGRDLHAKLKDLKAIAKHGVKQYKFGRDPEFIFVDCRKNDELDIMLNDRNHKVRRIAIDTIEKYRGES